MNSIKGGGPESFPLLGLPPANGAMPDRRAFLGGGGGHCPVGVCLCFYLRLQLLAYYAIASMMMSKCSFLAEQLCSLRCRGFRG